MSRFRHKGLVEAAQYGSSDLNAFFRADEEPVSRDDGALEVRYPPPNGSYLLATPGDWLLRHSDCALDCCSNVVFQATYEPVDPAQEAVSGEDRDVVKLAISEFESRAKENGLAPAASGAWEHAARRLRLLAEEKPPPHPGEGEGRGT